MLYSILINIKIHILFYFTNLNKLFDYLFNLMIHSFMIIHFSYNNSLSLTIKIALLRSFENTFKQLSKLSSIPTRGDDPKNI
jgi:hypothetical protein